MMCCSLGAHGSYPTPRQYNEQLSTLLCFTMPEPTSTAPAKDKGDKRDGYLRRSQIDVYLHQDKPIITAADAVDTPLPLLSRILLLIPIGWLVIVVNVDDLVPSGGRTLALALIPSTTRCDGMCRREKKVIHKKFQQKIASILVVFFLPGMGSHVVGSAALLAQKRDSREENTGRKVIGWSTLLLQPGEGQKSILLLVTAENDGVIAQEGKILARYRRRRWRYIIRASRRMEDYLSFFFFPEWRRTLNWSLWWAPLAVAATVLDQFPMFITLCPEWIVMRNHQASFFAWVPIS